MSIITNQKIEASFPVLLWKPGHKTKTKWKIYMNNEMSRGWAKDGINPNGLNKKYQTWYKKLDTYVFHRHLICYFYISYWRNLWKIGRIYNISQKISVAVKCCALVDGFSKPFLFKFFWISILLHFWMKKFIIELVFQYFKSFSQCQVRKPNPLIIVSG